MSSSANITVLNENSQLGNLFKTVVKGGYCIGCGACAAVSESPIQMQMDEYGKFTATINPLAEQSSFDLPVEAVCPFSSRAQNEDQIGQELFGKDCQYHNKIGYYQATYAGFVSEGNFRDRGSSGGMGTWIVTNLMLEGLVDRVIHVQPRHPSEDDPRLFHYQISTTIEQVKQGAKSRYYPIEMSEVIRQVREQPGRYAIVGIPCFLKAVRLLMRQDARLAERIKFCVGLVCGHLKSRRFADMFAWQCGIEPGNILEFDFRKKIPGRNANSYGIEVVGLKEGQVVTQTSPVDQLYGKDWGLGFFKYKACDYCDDVVAEAADVSVGDAWLPQYVRDSQGTNVVVVRHPKIRELLEQGMATGKLKLDYIDAEEVARSQESGFRHRRDGLAYRLLITKRRGEWYPPKRVQPRIDRSRPLFNKGQKFRVLLVQQSHIAFKEAVEARDFSLFVKKMEPLVEAYRASYHPPKWMQRAQRAKQFLRRLIG
ncbi:Coenzyme F420 hydrogenase/dehydrogenase, beta subunit C-terminal domain [Coleofasciculus sp.]|uniref:Coenzyme F420 hydrogenase/dehydrogenase, beta subunit C-terminal domain n=1 Tax=Coleofasciculus sp. TaxID=3100458 RepID=UPI0039FA06F0